MPSYCLQRGENTKNILQVSKVINGIIILSKYAVYGEKISKFIKKQEANRLLNNQVIRTLLSKISISCFECSYKMNDIINKFFLAGDKFMPEMHLRQPQFTYSVCGPCTKNKKRIQKFKKTGDTKYIYRNELDKACLIKLFSMIWLGKILKT